MAPRESEPQKETVERVMHEFKHGELRSGASGQKVKNRKQAVAIALSEAGASNQQTPKENENISAIQRRRSVAAKRQRTRPKARRRAAQDPPSSGPSARVPSIPSALRVLFGRPRAPSSWWCRGNFLRLGRGDHLGRRRNHNVGAGLGQVWTLFGLRLLQWRRRSDNVRLGNGYRLLGLRSCLHLFRTRNRNHSFSQSSHELRFRDGVASLAGGDSDRGAPRSFTVAPLAHMT